MRGEQFFICGAWDKYKGTISSLWLVLTPKDDHYYSGDKIIVSGKEYVLGKRELMSKGDVISYEIILASEILEL